MKLDKKSVSGKKSLYRGKSLFRGSTVVSNEYLSLFCMVLRGGAGGGAVRRVRALPPYFHHIKALCEYLIILGILEGLGNYESLIRVSM